jgi:O-antigen/teichoic acid export membrane protein
MLNKILIKAMRLVNDVNQKKTISFVAMRGLSVISNYIFSLLLIKLFSSEDYGVFIEALSILMILCVLLKFGIDVHFVKIFSDFKSIGVPKWIQKLERKVLYISIIISLILIIVFQFTNFFPGTKYGITMIILSIPVMVMIHLNSSKLRAISSIIKYAFLNITGRIFLSLCVLCVLYFVFNVLD